MTTTGILGTIRELGERTTVLEISPGVEMTVLKQAIMRTVNPDEEEFEYDEDDAIDSLDAIEGDTFDPERPIDPDDRTN